MIDHYYFSSVAVLKITNLYLIMCVVDGSNSSEMFPRDNDHRIEDIPGV